MTPTQYRDEVAQLAKTDTTKAAEIAEQINGPWFQAQAWSHLARYADRPLQFSRKAAKSASLCKDNYQKSAVRAWEIAALAERDYASQARKSLADALNLSETAEPAPSRAEALFLLFQAAFKISIGAARSTLERLNASVIPTIGGLSVQKEMPN
jgi:hypothetical protein